MRKRLHYDWHWVWPTGSGDLGNQGIHQMDIARWALGKPQLSPSVVSVGGRFGYVDDGETPNTQFVVHDYGDVLLIFEVRGLPEKPAAKEMDRYRGQSVGDIIECENGYLSDLPRFLTEDEAGYIPRDRIVLICTGSQGEPRAALARIAREDHPNIVLETGDVVIFSSRIIPGNEKAINRLQNALVRLGIGGRKTADLNAPILEGHLSSALCHTGNISYRLGRQASPDEGREALKSDKAACETLERFQAHLAEHKVDLNMTKATLGAFLKMDPKTERFIGNDKANALLTRDYRKPFVVPEKV